MRGAGAGVLVLLLLVVGAKALCLEPSTLACPEDREADECSTLVLRDDYPTLELSLLGLTNESYGAFIARLREGLGTSAKICGIPVLRSRTSVPMSERFVLVDITTTQGETATLAIDVVDVYIVGFRVRGDSFFTKPDTDDKRDAIRHLFPGTRRNEFPFTGAYDALERAAAKKRENIKLGAGALDTSVTSLIRYANYTNTTCRFRPVARGLIVCIQMISEAARFRYIEFKMKSRIQRSVNSEPDASVTSIVNTWGSMSKAIQRSSHDGVFERPIDLRRRNLSSVPVDNVRTVIPLISLLSFYCNPPSSSKQGLHYHPAAPVPVPAADAVIRLVTSSGPTCPAHVQSTLHIQGADGLCVDVRDGSYNNGNPIQLWPCTVPAADAVIRLVTSSDPTCPAHVQSTLHIQGADGLCVDVRDGSYNNGNPIQLWPCRSSNNRNQLWTFMADGTLRSNGKCLASSFGSTPADYIMIYDCRPGVAAFTWHAWPNGTISSATGLVLSTHSSASGTTLTARNNAFAPGQSWLVTNTTSPSVFKISGVSGLYCLHANGGDAVLQDCARASRWALYPDSTIRPEQRRNFCLASPGTQVNQPLNIVSCNPNTALQRWLFGNDGTIISFSTKLVIDVRGSAVSGAHLTLNSWRGTATQEWMPLL